MMFRYSSSLLNIILLTDLCTKALLLLINDVSLKKYNDIPKTGKNTIVNQYIGHFAITWPYSPPFSLTIMGNCSVTFHTIS